MAAIAVTLAAIAAMQVHRVVVQVLLVAASAALVAIQVPLAVRASALEVVQADQAAEAVNRTEATPAVVAWEVADKSRMIANYWGIEYLAQCPNQFAVRVPTLSLRHSPSVESHS